MPAAAPSAGHALVIVESPTKARTIRKFLGAGYQVEASMGHVRDLPSSAAEVPASIKGKPWARLAVDVEHGFEPVYVVPGDKKKVVAELKRALKDAEVVYLATDEDREGESIGWHLLQLLKPKVPTHRMVFHEITREAIQKALDAPRALDEKLVEAQEARRVLDRLVGYEVSPLLWKKVAPRLSAGRVQSVAVRLLVLRERERMAFVTSSWWGLKATAERSAQPFDAQLVAVGDKSLASGRDFDSDTGELIEGRDVLRLDEAAARALRERLADRSMTVVEVDRKEQVRNPYPPFTTSTLQQEANRKLGMSAARTMQVAQRLYENGHITYMRTDSVNLSNEAIDAVRKMIDRRYGAELLSKSPRRYSTSAKGAQEAHEAIRPAGTQMPTVAELKLSGEEGRLYELIWKRTVATQMASAIVAMTTVKMQVQDPADGKPCVFRASGREVLFPGFFRAYVEGTDDPGQMLDDQSSPLPRLDEGDVVDNKALEAVGHETRPPARYTEATLVKALETQGIGRPSTYASIIETIQRRGYVQAQQRQLVPTFTAMAVTNLLEQTLGKVVDVEFTAAMESWLDQIADGQHDREAYLQDFYERVLQGGVQEGEQIDAREVCTIKADRLGPYAVRLGRYGPFVELPAEGEEKPKSLSLPPEVAPADVDEAFIDKLRAQAEQGEAPLGDDPETGLPVYVRVGRFGPYVQLGETTDDNKKPKRSSLPPKTKPEDIDLEKALALLSLPRQIGAHPETGAPVEAGIGRYGPYVVHQKVYASLKAGDDVLGVDLPRALQLLEEKKNARSRKPSALRELGAHPEDGQPVVVMDGRYGPYVKHDKTNASLPEGVTVEAVTMEQAVELLAARAKAPKRGKKGSTKKAAGETTTAKKSTAKKAPAKKAPAKKAAAKKTPAKKATARKATAKKAATSEATGDAPAPPKVRKGAAKRPADPEGEESANP